MCGGGPTCLRQLELLQVDLLHDLVPEHVGGGEEPAALAILLVRDGPGLEVQLSVEDVHVRDERLAALEGTIEGRMVQDRARKSRLN